jgi:hypothetical protein
MFLAGLVGFWVVERQGQRRESALGRARIATRRAGWLPFAGPSGWPILIVVLKT